MTKEATARILMALMFLLAAAILASIALDSWPNKVAIPCGLLALFGIVGSAISLAPKRFRDRIGW